MRSRAHSTPYSQVSSTCSSSPNLSPIDLAQVRNVKEILYVIFVLIISHFAAAATEITRHLRGNF